MNREPESFNANDASIEAEALAWLAQIDGDRFTDKDLVAFKDWVQRSPVHAKKIQDLNSFWGELNVLTNMAGPIARADKVSKDLRKSSGKGRIVFLSSLACAAFAIAALVSPAFIGSKIQSGEEPVQTAQVQMPDVYKTPIGTHQTYTLSDGSKLTLNTDTVVEVEYLADQRVLRLRRGEALFDVVSDPQRPFLVIAEDHLVRAVGTAFTVKLRPGSVDVLVSEGVVELSAVTAQSDPLGMAANMSSLARMSAGHAARLEASGASIQSLSEEDVAARLSWKHGLLTFRGESLEYVIGEVGRYTDKQIILADSDLSTLRVGGVYKAGDIDSFTSNLEANFNIVVDRSAPEHIVLSKE